MKHVISKGEMKAFTTGKSFARMESACVFSFIRVVTQRFSPTKKLCVTTLKTAAKETSSVSVFGFTSINNLTKFRPGSKQRPTTRRRPPSYYHPLLVKEKDQNQLCTEFFLNKWKTGLLGSLPFSKKIWKFRLKVKWNSNFWENFFGNCRLPPGQR